jgi:putative glycosyltransferase (TIGR04372 family)
MFGFINKGFGYIRKRSPILIQTPRSTVYGNCAEEILYGLLKAKRENKKVLFLYPKFPWSKRKQLLSFNLPTVANQELLHVQSCYSISNQNVLVWLIGWTLGLSFTVVLATHILWGKVRRKLQRVWPKIGGDDFFDPRNRILAIGRAALWRPDGAKEFSWETVKTQNWEQQYHEYLPPRLKEERQRVAEQILVQMGIPLTDWFACLHVRESGYHHDVYGNRNGSVQNYLEGIKSITDTGGWVVRLGDPSMTPLPHMEHVIDYPHTAFKSELMDIYLTSQCRFFVAATSGATDVASLFWKPMIRINFSGWAVSFPLRKTDLGIIKHIYSLSCNRFLSLKEILDGPFGYEDFNYHSDEYILVENTTDEIKDVIEEFLTRPADFEYSELQKAFNAGRVLQIQRWFDLQSSKGDPANLYRIGSRVDSVAGVLGHKYLEQNWLEDSLERSGVRPSISAITAGEK